MILRLSPANDHFRSPPRISCEDCYSYAVGRMRVDVADFELWLFVVEPLSSDRDVV